MNELQEIRNDMLKAAEAGDILLCKMYINKLDTFIYENQALLKQAKEAQQPEEGCNIDIVRLLLPDAEGIDKILNNTFKELTSKTAMRWARKGFIAGLKFRCNEA